jgi:uncharacterized protein (TIGR02996 family)
VSEAYALLRDICENPADDGLRLVYADWLEENGQPERAEFIRIQIERARLTPENSRQEELRRRQQELLAGHGPGWLGELPRLSGVNWMHFWRGFVAGAHVMRWRFFRTQADALFAATPLQFLYLLAGVAPQTYPLLLHSPYLSRLCGLYLCDNVLTNEGARALAECPALANLEILEVRGRFHTFPLPSFGDAGAFALADSPHLRRLKRLDVRWNFLGDRAVEALRRRFGERVLLA